MRAGVSTLHNSIPWTTSRSRVNVDSPVEQLDLCAASTRASKMESGAAEWMSVRAKTPPLTIGLQPTC